MIALGNRPEQRKPSSEKSSSVKISVFLGLNSNDLVSMNNSIYIYTHTPTSLSLSLALYLCLFINFQAPLRWRRLLMIELWMVKPFTEYLVQHPWRHDLLI